MGAVGVHHGATDDAAWDGPANEARLRSGEGLSYYRRAYAWQDPDGDPETKTAWRFIHHFVGSDGNPGAASTRACSAGIAVLNGGRGGTTIPDGDRRGVWNHLAAHLRDAEMEPPDLRGIGQPHGAAPTDEVERRSVAVTELRVADEEGKRPRIVGYGAVFDQLSEVLGSFRERIRRGAFAKTLQEADVRSLFNHNPDYVLGRTSAGTLRLAEDERGLRYEVEPPDTQWARDLLVSVRRGDVTQMSFGFEAVRDEWNRDADPLERTLVEVRLYDVGPVTFPAYPQTSAQVRARLSEIQDSAPVQEDHPEAGDEGEWQERLATMRRRLELLDIGY